MNVRHVRVERSQNHFILPIYLDVRQYDMEKYEERIWVGTLTSYPFTLMNYDNRRTFSLYSH